MQRSELEDNRAVLAQSADQECSCGHARYLHDDGAGACIDDVSFGVPCRCREFEEAQ